MTIYTLLKKCWRHGIVRYADYSYDNLFKLLFGDNGEFQFAVSFLFEFYYLGN